MTRGLDAAQITHIESDRIKPTWLAEFDFSSGIQRATTAPFSLFFDADEDTFDEEFFGIGDLGGITGIEEKIDGSAHAIELSLSLIDGTLLSKALTEHVQGRRARLWAAWLDDDNDFIGLPQLRFVGIMDTMPFKFAADGKTAVISVRIVSRDVIWERPNRTPRYTDGDHQARHPGDTFFSRLPQINGGKEITWGVDTV